MNIKNQIKAQIMFAGFTMAEVVDALSTEYGWSDSLSNFSAKLSRESRVLNNQTYMGVMAYGKSYNNNYLDQKRINNHDKPNTYGYQCYNILNNGSASQCRKAGADDTGYCDQPMIADWKLELMGKKILELVFQDKQDLIDHTCDMIRKCLQTARPQGVTLSNIVGKMERIKFKKEMLLEMRTDGEITKQEFLDQRKKLDKELQELQAEYDSKAYNPVIEMDQPEWGKIQAALEEMLDLSQPKPSPDLIRKFVAQIVPEGKSNFQWHLNLDGGDATIQDMTVEGRKNHAVVTICAGEHDALPDPDAVIDLQNTSILAIPHRLQSRANRIT